MPRRIKQRPPSLCDAPGCDAIIPRGRLMCRDHWYAVPRPLRLEISKAWKERRIRDWSANRFEAIRFLRENPTGKQEPAVPAVASVTPERSAKLRDRLLGERAEA